MNPFDVHILLWVNGFVGHVRAFDAAMEVVANDYIVPIMFSLVLMGLWFAGRNREERFRLQRIALIGITSFSLVNVAVKVLNIAWYRDRPFVAMPHQIHLLFYNSTDPSFPSNPVAVAFAAATAIWLANRKLGAVMYALGALFGFARMYAGVFYPTDILGGAALGILTTMLVIRIADWIEPIPTLFLRFMRALSLA